MSDLKIQVLAVGQPQSGNNNGRAWNRVQLQVFAGEIACNHTVYADNVEDLQQYKSGFYMAKLNPRAGQNGRLEFSIGELTPVGAKQ